MHLLIHDLHSLNGDNVFPFKSHDAVPLEDVSRRRSSKGRYKVHKFSTIHIVLMANLSGAFDLYPLKSNLNSVTTLKREGRRTLSRSRIPEAM